MYPNQPHASTFYHHQPTYHFRAPDAAQPRVGNYGSERVLMQPYKNFYTFRTPGLILGGLILFFTLALISTELGRLYSGSNNRGRGDTNTSATYLMYPSAIVGLNGYPYNPKTENRWMWPWSTATLLFSLVFFTAGLLGIISGQRENYPSILAFFIFSLVSLCLLIFLIATYSTIIAGWRSIYDTSDGNRMPRYARIDRDLAIVCLSISCFLWLLSLVSLISSGRTIDACSRKSYYHGENEPERLLSPAATPRFGY